MHLCGALAMAAMAVACGGRTSATNGGAHREQTGGKRGVDQRVVLRGCVQPAGEGQGYALRHVRLQPADLQHQDQDTIDRPIIAQGSSVRLAGGDDFTKYVDHEVAVTGDIVDTGENTIGTAGQGGSAQEQQPPQANVPNRDAPRVAVERIEKIADNCAGD
jgi:hypothetical protein